jgi:hypothetical protein
VAASHVEPEPSQYKSRISGSVQLILAARLDRLIGFEPWQLALDTIGEEGLQRDRGRRTDIYLRPSHILYITCYEWMTLHGGVTAQAATELRLTVSSNHHRDSSIHGGGSS